MQPRVQQVTVWAEWLAYELRYAGADEVFLHRFMAPLPNSVNGELVEGINVVGVVRAKRAAGNEAIAMSARYSAPERSWLARPRTVDSVGMGIAIINCMSGAYHQSMMMMMTISRS